MERSIEFVQGTVNINDFDNSINNLIILDDAGNSTIITPASGILPAITTLSALIVDPPAIPKSHT